jgi:hypothetical protein
MENSGLVIIEVLTGRRTKNPLFFDDHSLDEMNLEGVGHPPDHDTTIRSSAILRWNPSWATVKWCRRHPLHDLNEILRRRIDVASNEAHDQLIDGMR